VITHRGVDSSVPLEERERFHLQLRKDKPVSSVVLATCDRIEVYEGEGSPSPEVVRHLFRVVSGLESPMLGENQIQAQVKQAYEDARVAGGLDAGIHRLFQQALRVGKRVRTETKLNRGAAGHAQMVVALLQTLPVPLPELKILVVGVNHLNRGILRFLVDRGQQTFFLGNRTLTRACEVVNDLGAGQALALERLNEVLASVDVVISATSAPHFIVHNHQLPATGGPRWFFDLAVPRDVDPSIADRPGVTLWNVTDLEREAARNLEGRRAEVGKAETLLEEEVSKFFAPRAVRP
jgi:glutamyl-tRNA reductase